MRAGAQGPTRNALDTGDIVGIDTILKSITRTVHNSQRSTGLALFNIGSAVKKTMLLEIPHSLVISIA